ncbi:MAG: Rossmann-like domain-containing protein [Thermodesulfobacteriota bacterium]
MSGIWQDLRQKSREIFQGHLQMDTTVSVKAAPLSVDEAIGNPEESDYPLQKGKERLMQAEFRGCAGQAYTDEFGDYQASLDEIIGMELTDNFKRGVFVASINAVLRYLDRIEGTIHCRDSEPAVCADNLRSHIQEWWGEPKVGIFGLQPRFVQYLSDAFPLRAVDMDPDNIGANKFGVTIEGPELTQDAINWADLLLVTGTTLVNDTIEQFLYRDRPVLFYGTTIAGAAYLMGWDRFCSRSE